MGTVNLYDVVDVTTPIVANGAAVVANLSIPGTKMLLPFSGIQGHRMAVKVVLANSTNCSPSWKITVLKTDGAQVATSGNIGCTSTSYFLEPFALPSTETFRISFDPLGTHTATATVNLYDVVDLTGSLTINAAATPLSLTPGQAATLTFNGTTGQLITVRLTGNTIGNTLVKLLKWDLTPLTSKTSSSSSFTLTQQTVPSPGGTLTVVIDPVGSNTGNISVQVTNP